MHINVCMRSVARRVYRGKSSAHLSVRARGLGREKLFFFFTQIREITGEKNTGSLRART